MQPKGVYSRGAQGNFCKPRSAGRAKITQRSREHCGKALGERAAKTRAATPTQEDSHRRKGYHEGTLLQLDGCETGACTAFSLTSDIER